MTPAALTDYDHGISAVDTEYIRPRLDASHLIVESGRAAFVDTGTNNSVPKLLDALRQKNLRPDDVDYVFLTHIHLDHAGGAGRLMRELPNARCVVHPRGAAHMAEPSKLIAGTQAVYGEALAYEMYGDILPIDAERILEPDDGESYELAGRRLTAYYTEGHARHHYVLHDPTACAVFTGDSFGLSYRDLDTEAGAFIFPTTTPTHFDPEQAHVSVDRIMGLEPKRLYLTHYSEVTELDRLAADMHHHLDAFVAISKDAIPARERVSVIRKGLFDHLADRIRAHGFKGDTEAIRNIIWMDCELNAQGLDIWLKRQGQ
ncbi:MAG: MBL fold metallo-hydrolase [Woeseiaceae bacterium]|nr:MBL fold metallo-hydrolase [Woeseiaceae bacterium]